MALIEKAMPLSGGAGLNFSIVGGTEEPVNPKENTIWVNTDTSIGEWQFSATEPTTKADGTALQNGDVWIVIGASGPVQFNILNKNCISLIVTGSFQYINNIWTKKDMQAYYGGTWNVPILYILKDSTLNNNAKYYTESSSSMGFSGGKFSYSRNNIYYNEASVCITDPFNFSGVKELTINVNSNSNTNIVFGVRSTVGTTYNPVSGALVTKTTTGTGRITLDVSGVTGVGYVFIFFSMLNNQSGGSATIDEFCMV